MPKAFSINAFGLSYKKECSQRNKGGTTSDDATHHNLGWMKIDTLRVWHAILIALDFVEMHEAIDLKDFLILPIKYKFIVVYESLGIVPPK